MNIFSRLRRLIEGVIRKLIPYKTIAQVERVESTLSTEMETSLDLWHEMYINKAPWLADVNVKSLNLAAFIASEIARQIVLEMEVDITGKDGADSPRAEYLRDELQKLLDVLRIKLEQGCAAGGMVIKPYPNQADGHIYFDCSMDWGIYPLTFDDLGMLSDVVIPDKWREGKTVYTRLERHTKDGNGVHITQRAFKSQDEDSIGTEISLGSVDRWASLEPESTITNTDGMLFGWYKVASANSVDADAPLGASVFAKARDIIKEADMQYSRLLWEYEGSELAIDVDPMVLRPSTVKDPRGRTRTEMPKLNERLFRGVDLGKDDNYNVFAPTIRDTSIINGLNQLLCRIEDLCGLSRGTISDANIDARTATELKIVKQRSYATIADNQRALEACLRDVVHAMDVYTTVYNFAPEGEYEASFRWDDSIIIDTETKMAQLLTLVNSGVMSKAEFREWYFDETEEQAQARLAEITSEQTGGFVLPTITE